MDCQNFDHLEENKYSASPKFYDLLYYELHMPPRNQENSKIIFWGPTDSPVGDVGVQCNQIQYDAFSSNKIQCDVKQCNSCGFSIASDHQIN